MADAHSAHDTPVGAPPDAPSPSRPRASIRARAAKCGIVGFALFALMLLAACHGGEGATKTSTLAPVSEQDAQALLVTMVLQPADVATDYVQEQAHPLTNDEAARARPDTDAARKQYAGWGQVLQYNVQYAAPTNAELVFNAKLARIMNSATIYQTVDGATQALDYFRGLAPNVVANFLVNDGSGTKISDTQVVKDIDFPVSGDESFAWRMTGKATFDNGFVINFVADSVFLRSGRVTGNVTAVALGEAPQREDVVTLVGRFLSRVKAAGA